MRGQAHGIEGDHLRARDELRTAERLVAEDGPVLDALLQARLALVGLNLMLADAAEALAMAEAIEFNSPYFGRDDGRAVAAVATGDLDTVMLLIRRHAADAASGSADAGVRLDPAGVHQDSPEEALADLRAELARRGWAS